MKLNGAQCKYVDTFLCVCYADSDISSFIQSIEAQDLKVEMMRRTDYMSAAPHSAAINVSGSSKVTQRHTHTYTYTNTCMLTYTSNCYTTT